MEFLGWYAIGDAPTNEDALFHEQVYTVIVYSKLMSNLPWLLDMYGPREQLAAQAKPRSTDEQGTHTLNLEATYSVTTPYPTSSSFFCSSL